jgi:hypothetical protein
MKFEDSVNNLQANLLLAVKVIVLVVIGFAIADVMNFK